MTKLNGEQDGILKDLRLIESRSNQTKDDCNVDKLGSLGSQKGFKKLTISLHSCITSESLILIV